MGKKPTLIILTPGFPGNEDDTTCIPPQQVFVNAVKENFPELNIIVLSFIYPFSNKNYQWKNISVTSFNGGKYRGPLKYFLWKKIRRELEQLEKDNEVAGLLSFWYGECAWIGHQFASQRGLKHYCWILGQDARKQNRFVQRINAPGTELIALSDFIQKEFEANHGIRPEHIIPPGVDIKMFSEKISAERPIDILGAGSLIGLKQYEIFARTVFAVKKIHPAVKAAICGKGPEEESLLALVEELELKENIVLKGELPHTDVLSLMQQSKIFLHPSSYEGFGVVCLEALYAGAEVVSFVKPMNKEIDHWHIVKSVDEMTDKVINILDFPLARHESILPYTASEAARKIMELFGF